MIYDDWGNGPGITEDELSNVVGVEEAHRIFDEIDPNHYCDIRPRPPSPPPQPGSMGFLLREVYEPVLLEMYKPSPLFKLPDEEPPKE